MVLTWKGNPVAFTSVPIARAIRLHWEDLKDAYTISFNSCGGSVIDAIALPYNSAITPLANDPEKMGYVLFLKDPYQNHPVRGNFGFKMPVKSPEVFLPPQIPHPQRPTAGAETQRREINPDCFVIISIEIK